MNHNFCIKTILLLFLTSWKIVCAQEFDIQGHRGARGLLPENTIPGFIAALDSGVTTLELDVLITRDKQVLVSHDPYLSHKICSKPDGSEITVDDEKKLTIYDMTYDEIRFYDCGMKIYSDFPEQFKMHAHKPLLSDVIKSVERYIKSYTRFEVDYNIELKSWLSSDEKFHPPPPEFSNRVYELIDQYLPTNRIIIQSFDFRILRYWKEKYPKIRLSALVENTKSIDTNLANLNFKPTIYSPDYKRLNKKRIKDLQKQGIKVIPWTINDEKTMSKFIKWGVDGIISDYPNLLKKVYKQVDTKNSSK